MITQKTLKKLMKYDPVTGVFKYTAKTKATEIGDVAGYKGSYGYLIIQIDTKKYRAHRLAWLYMKGVHPNKIDHVNHVRHDNRWYNLRNVSNAENGKNRTMQANNSSGITGVGWTTRNKKWQSYIRVNGKHIYLGYFADKFEAICARKSANNKYGFHCNHGVG
jgi:hypothetical protein